MKRLNIILTLAAAMTFSSLTCLPEANAQTSDPIETTNLTDAGAYLQGKFSGLLVMNPSGAPGETAKLRVRGFTSSDGNGGPLLIVDGLKVENIQHLDPSMIEKVEVLKDAAATALYGIQGGNGVILITTKKGSGKVSVSYDFKLTSSSLGRKADLMNAEEWIQHKIDNGISDIREILEANGYDGTDTDWQDVMYGNGFAHQHGISLQGGNSKGGFYAAVNYLDNNGIVKGSSDTHRRIAAQVNGDYKVTDWLKLGINASLASQDISYIHQQQKYGSAFKSLLNMDPVTKPYFSTIDEFTPEMLQEYNEGKDIPKDPSNGLYYGRSLYTNDFFSSPLLQKDTQRTDGQNQDINGVISAKVTPFKGFAFTARFGYRLEQQDRYENARVFERMNSGYQADAFAEYNLSAGSHALNAKAGMYFESLTQTFRDGSANSSLPLEYDDINITTYDYEVSDLAFFAQAGYTFSNRYSIQASIRADQYKADRFIGEDAWNMFPAVSAEWDIANEPFITDNIDRNVVSHLAIKGSWGKGGHTGDLEGLYNPVSKGYHEISSMTDAGIEAQMLKGRLNLAADWYIKQTEGVPTFIGITPYSVKNQGIDIDLSWSDKVGDFSYRIAGNFSTLQNEVTAFEQDYGLLGIKGKGNNDRLSTFLEEGKTMWYFRGCKDDPVQHSEPCEIGQGIPTAYFGAQINLAYKGFDFCIQGNGTAGNDIAFCDVFYQRLYRTNTLRDIAAIKWDESYRYSSDAVIFDGSYFRIRQLQLGYTLPLDLTRKIFMKNARVFVSLDDWFTFSNYPGGDPETATTGTRLTDLWYPIFTDGQIKTEVVGNDKGLGIDYGSYPMSKKLVFGLSIRF